jgi:YfiH family protein
VDPSPAADSVFDDRRGLPVLRWPVFEGFPIEVFVTTRHGGVSEGPYRSLNVGLHVGDDRERVLENRRRVADAAGVTLDDMVFCRQTHGRGTAVVTREEAGRGARREEDALDGVDAVVTDQPGLALVMMGADCTPMALYDPEAGVVGCVHSGWRGTTARVAEAALEAMAAGGAVAERVIAAVGPTVPALHYQVGPEVVEAATSALGDLDGVAAPDGTGRWTFDLVAANCRVLVGAGVRPANIHRAALDTWAPACFSDRAERPCGRQAVVAVLRS